MSRYEKLSITLICFIILFSHKNSYCFEPWQLVYPSQTLELSGIASNDSTIVAVGFKGGVFLGVNDTCWKIIPVENMPVMHCIIWNKGKYIAVGDSGAIYTSQTGYTWMKQNSGFISKLTNVYGDTEGNLLVAIGNDGLILTSTDGLNWIKQVSPTTTDLRQILFDGHDWIILANVDTILYSHDAIQWKVKDTDTSSNAIVTYICTNDTNILAITAFINTKYHYNYASTCSTWTGLQNFNIDLNKYCTDHRPINCCYWDGNSWVLESWNQPASEGGEKPYECPVIKSNNLTGWYIDGSRCGKYSKLQGKQVLHIQYEPNTNFFYKITRWDGSSSKDSILYSQSKANIDLRCAAWNETKMVVAGTKGTILTSDDLFTWSKSESPTSNNLNSVVWTGKSTIIVGENGTIVRSEDCKSWKTINSNTKINFSKIILGPDRIITVGEKNILTSVDDGLTWTRDTLPITQNIKDLIYDGVSYFGLSERYHSIGCPILIQSADAKIWNEKELFQPYSGYNAYGFENLCFSKFGVITCGYAYVLEGYSGGYKFTITSTQFGVVSSGYFYDRNVNADYICASNLQMVTACKGYKGSLSSSDAKNWTYTEMPLKKRDSKINQIVFMGSYFVAVGNEGQIWISLAKDEIASITKVSSKQKHSEHSIYPINSVQLQYASNTITYNISQPQNITLCLYSINGKLIAVIDKGQKSVGQHIIAFNSSKLNSGTYFFRLTTGKQMCTSKRIVNY
jgi:hypothetical protein